MPRPDIFDPFATPHQPKRTSPKHKKSANPNPFGLNFPPASYLTFASYAFQVDAQGGHHSREFSALCGDDDPKITDGYAKWTVIDRPLRQGITVPQGFNPAQLKVSIRMGVWDARFDFHGWDKSAAAATEVESNVRDLHWMAGGNFEAGPSPIVYIDSWLAPRVRSHLVPRDYWGVGWVINGGIEWGQSWRHRNGSRIYQEATFTAMGYASLGHPPPGRKHKFAGGYFKTTKQAHTALAIASSPSSQTPQAFREKLARDILAAHQNNPCHRRSGIKLRRYSIIQPMPVGLDVWVPSRTF